MFDRACIIVISCLLLLHSGLSYAYKDDIGHTKLATELGINLPNGNSVTVSQAEADTDGVVGSPYLYFPDITDTRFTGKIITNVSNLNDAPSAHATGVGGTFYGNYAMANGVINIYVYEVNNWLQADYLRFGSSWQPISSTSRIGNHSWVGATGNLSYDSDILRRLDWVIETDEFLQFVGTKNSTGINSNLLSAAYNVVTVGKTDGLHSTGSAQIDSTYVAGRTRTEIVAPFAWTSNATPVVAATAAILIETGHSNPGLSNGSTSNRNGDTIYNAERSETIKAALLAGADRLTKNTSTTANITDYRVELNQTANGLDARFGAGQVNVYNSYHIIAAGEQNSAEDDGSSAGSIGTFGFDYDPSFGGSSGSNNVASYYFSTGTNPQILKASLAWNIDIAGGNKFNFNGTSSIYDLDLMLYDITGSQTLLISSTSSVDNTENIWTSLPAGRDYLLQVLPKTGQSDFLWDYALAWHIASDIDGDVISDVQDNCPSIFNANQADLDGDAIGDVCDNDIDGDGVANAADAFPLDATETTDTDNDGTGNNADTDDDNDGLLDIAEDINANGVVDAGETDSLNYDTDGDGYNDGEEVAAGSDPLDLNSVPVSPDGDINNDGIVNVVDILIAQQILGGQLTPTSEQLAHGDVAPLISGVPTPDGQFNVGDLVVIMRKATGMIDF
ncbi:MAG: thrombospondin type 3 repeat-containing protein [Gammaproteobacteria bacterium]|nr:thrombospondin type 3 repeat-containing protein [Gammaproteobacteria bacterium]